MQLFLRGASFQYETENIIRLFFPYEKIETFQNGTPTDSKFVIAEVLKYDDGTVEIIVQVYLEGYQSQLSNILKDVPPSSPVCEREVARMLYKCLTRLTSIKVPWGILTGVRPGKLMRSFLNSDGENDALRKFKTEYLVSQPKAELALRVAKRENEIIRQQLIRPASIYVAIPFCPTRCSYCSFVSHSIDSAKKLIPDYVEKLCLEIEQTAKIVEDLNLNIGTVYIGGGTPTSIDDEFFEKILSKIREYIPFENVREFTVEAGRPDTITENKLDIMKKYGVDRISINPQTFHEDVLKNIGRSHNVEDIYTSFNMAREKGFDNINMDLIAGLPGDSVERFVESIQKAVLLKPENITVHTLAMKRASNITVEHEQESACKDTMQMLENGNRLLYENGYNPYYMYRQSKSVGNLENVGWERENKDCLYNVYMMEETQTVLSCGAGAVTKLVDEDRLDRVFNFKYPYEYISRFDQIEERKEKIYNFYDYTRE